MLQVPSNNEYNSTSSVLKIEAEYFFFFYCVSCSCHKSVPINFVRYDKNTWCLPPSQKYHEFVVVGAHGHQNKKNIPNHNYTQQTHTHSVRENVWICFALGSRCTNILYMFVFIDALSVANHAFFSRNSHVAPREWKADGNQKKQQQKVRPTFGLIPILISGNMIYGSLFFSLLRIILVFFFFCSCCSVLMKDSWTKTMADTRWREEKIMLFNSKCDDCDSHMPFFLCIFVCCCIRCSKHS